MLFHLALHESARVVLRSGAVIRKLLMMIFREEHPCEETGGGSGGGYRRIHAGRCLAAIAADAVSREMIVECGCVLYALCVDVRVPRGIGTGLDGM